MLHIFCRTLSGFCPPFGEFPIWATSFPCTPCGTRGAPKINFDALSNRRGFPYVRPQPSGVAAYFRPGNHSNQHWAPVCALVFLKSPRQGFQNPVRHPCGLKYTGVGSQYVISLWILGIPIVSQPVKCVTHRAVAKMATFFQYYIYWSLASGWQLPLEFNFFRLSMQQLHIFQLGFELPTPNGVSAAQNEKQQPKFFEGSTETFFGACMTLLKIPTKGKTHLTHLHAPAMKSSFDQNLLQYNDFTSEPISSPFACNIHLICSPSKLDNLEFRFQGGEINIHVRIKGACMMVNCIVQTPSIFCAQERT